MKNKIIPTTGTLNFTQSPDDFDENIVQSLSVTVEDAGAGPFYILKTDRWSFNTIEELVVLLNKVKETFGVEDDVSSE